MQVHQMMLIVDLYSRRKLSSRLRIGLYCVAFKHKQITRRNLQNKWIKREDFKGLSYDNFIRLGEPEERVTLAKLYNQIKE